MLEHNTDRSYFMIGAIVIAAALIGIGVAVFGDSILGGVKGLIETFMGQAETASGAISGVEGGEGGE